MFVPRTAPDAGHPSVATDLSVLITPFNAQQAQEKRDAWARHLSIDSQITLRSLDMEMVLIPAGQFAMGSPETPEELQKAFPYLTDEWLAGERPVHRVTISQPFYMAKYEVTVGQFRKFVAETGYRSDAENNGQGGWGFAGDHGWPWQKRPDFNWQSCGMPQRDDFPVMNMSWQDATAFCEWISRKEGKKFRLPTEAEFEYACRAGTTTRYYNGDDPEQLTKIANVWDATVLKQVSTSQNTLASSDGWAFAAPVGQFAPNNFGLYDMLGNANEWCFDWYDEHYYSNSPDTDPMGPGAGTARVIRGGGWGLFAGSCRSADRHFESPAYCDGDLGFRVVYVP